MTKTAWQWAVDLGNTALTCGIFKGQRLVSVETLLCDRPARVWRQDVSYFFVGLKRKYPRVQRVCLCSVVPEKTGAVLRALRVVKPAPLMVVGRDCHVPLKNHYRPPSRVGADRLVGAYAGTRVAGLPLIVVDLGTALTFDAVSRAGVYEGGLILPGLRLAAEALAHKTSLLPQVEIDRPRRLIGRTTEESILSGLFYGYGALIQGVCAQLKKELGRSTSVILTGGYTRIVKQYFPHFDCHIRPHLVLEGLNQLASESA